MLKNWLSACDRGGVALIVLVSFSGKLISPRSLCPHNMPHEFRWWQRIQEQTADLDQDIDSQRSSACESKVKISLKRKRFGLHRSSSGHGKCVWEWGCRIYGCCFLKVGTTKTHRLMYGRHCRILSFLTIENCYRELPLKNCHWGISIEKICAARKRLTDYLIPL